MNTLITQLNSELTNLSSESKRRNPDIKQASDKSLDVLKNYNHQIPETEFLKNLSKNPDFITPFLLSCQTRNPKYISISISCFQKLISSNSIPITKIELLLDALIESTNLAIEIQLKILQCLPFLFQNYSMFINDKNLFKLLSICSMLQNSNKSTIVSNTASATLSQLINLVFEKINDEDKAAEIDKSYVVPIDNDQTINVGLNAYDGQRIFLDLCTLIVHHKPQFLKTNYITENFGFEIMESIIKTNRELILNHVELGFLLRTKIVPILLRFFSSSKDFTIMVRVTRLILLLVKEQFTILKVETEVILSLLNHILTKDSSSPFWKKILSLEIYKQIMSDFSLVESFFVEFDYQNESKQIFNDFLQNSFDILNDNKSLLNTGDIVQPPITIPSSPRPLDTPELPGLFWHKSTTKINFIDLLDKLDPPLVNETYLLYLILSSVNHFCEGACKYLTDLVQNDNIDTLFIKDLITKNYKSILSIYQIIIFSTLDQDFFNKSIRSLQKICHLSGILLINESRDEFLKFLIKATLNLSGKNGYQHKNSVYSIGESIVGTISSTINQALTTTPNQQHVIYTRQINSRNVLCFRVLISLAISLGTVLQGNWRLIIISLQWMDYFINGPSENTRDISQLPQLTSQELINIENSIKKLNENINFYSTTVFNDIIKSMISLTNDLIDDDGMLFNKQPIIDQENFILIQPCSFNKIFLINKMMELCKINPKKFLIGQDFNWSIILLSYFKLTSNRSLTYEFRMTISKDFNSIIKYMAIDGFDSQSPNTELQILQSLDSFLQNLISFPKPDELLVWNCELEIQSQVLDTLKFLLDKYGTSFQHWDLVFNIINSSFARDSENDKLKPVINSSFEGLKMILDEFLSSLPSDQLRILIECILNFISQTVDLNISLNSISYFWLIGDYLRSSSTERKPVKKLDSKEELFQLVSEKNDDFELLYIYLLYSLSQTIHDPRLQVRNGSIQTFFNIIDSHGSRLHGNWGNIYHYIFTELLTASNKESEWIDSYYLLLTGFVKLFNKFLSKDFDNDIIEYWLGLISFFNELISLQNIELNLKIYKNFQDLISPFTELPNEILELFYKFWSSTKIIYNLVQNNSYQDSLTSLMECFPKLFELIQPILDVTKYLEIMNILNSCVRYPVLPDHFANDDLRLTPLQESVLVNLTKLVDTTSRESLELNSILLLQLNSIIVLPFKTRDKILDKFNKIDQKQQIYKIPTFISISHRTMDLLSIQLDKCDDDIDFFIKDGSLLKIYKSLLEPIQLKSKGISIKQDLWIQCIDLIMSLNDKIIIKTFNDQNWWSVIIKLINIINQYDQDDDDIEQIDISNLSKLYDLIISNISNIDKQLVNEFVKNVYDNSFLHKLHDIEKLIKDKDSIEYCINLPFDNINDSILIVKCHRLNLKKFNLTKLISFTSIPNIDQHFFKMRICIAIWKFLNINMLINKSPIFEIQKFEILQLLNGYYHYLKQLKIKEVFLNSIILKLIPFVNKVQNLDSLIINILTITH